MTPRPTVEDARRYRNVIASPITRDQRDMRPQADMTNVRPHHEDRVLVRRLKKNRYANGFPRPFIQLENQEGRDKVGHQFGIVVSVASKAYDVKPGDVVIYTRFPSNEFEQDGETYTFLYEEQAILAVLE